MGQYGNIALDALDKLVKGVAKTPRKAWREALRNANEEDSLSDETGCPRNAFFALCQSGFVKGVPRGKYTTSSKNLLCVQEAVRIMSGLGGRIPAEMELWAEVHRNLDFGSEYDQQMEVVCALAKAGKLIIPKEPRGRTWDRGPHRPPRT